MTMTNPIELDLTAPVSAAADADIPSRTSQDSVRAFETALEGQPSGENASLQETLGAAMKAVAEDASPETLKAVVDETLSLELPKPLMIESDLDQDAAAPVIAAPVIAAPVVVPQQIEAAPVESADPSVRAGAVEAVSRATEAVSAAETMVRAAEAVADAILVSPGLRAGDGEMLIRLRPDVLDGSTVRITVSGRQLGVEFQPVQMETAVLIERNMSQLQQHLVARVHTYTIGVSVKKDRYGRA